MGFAFSDDVQLYYVPDFQSPGTQLGSWRRCVLA